MNIPKQHVDFPIAKLLKEKGCAIKCNSYYEQALTSKKDKENGYSGDFGWKKGELNLQSGFFINGWNKTDYTGKNWFMCAAPEIWQVVEWLFQKHNIWIVILPELLNGEQIRYYPSFFEDGVGEDIEEYFNSPQEAYQASFKYILEEMI
jgi:hypothetical protein